MPKGVRLTDEHRAKLRQAALHRSDVWRVQVSEKLTGRPRPPEVRAAISESLSGRQKKPWDDMTVRGKHRWIQNNFTDPGACESCGARHKPLEWASPGHVYTQQRSDWRRLCRSCHHKMDGRRVRCA